jgi:hypothetical protein
LEPQKPYHLTLRGVLNPNASRYYGVGYRRLEGASYADYANGEFFFIELNNKNNERTVFASKTLGNGLTPTWLEPVYDASRDILIDFDNNQLWFVDALTGDRVIKPIALPSN